MQNIIVANKFVALNIFIKNLSVFNRSYGPLWINNKEVTSSSKF